MPDVPPYQEFATAVPTELSLEVNLDKTKFNLQPWETKLIDSNLNQTTGAVITGVTYNYLASIGITSQGIASKYGGYILTASENRYAGYITLLFAAPKTPEQANTAISTNIETVNGIYWHPILKDLRFVPVSYGFTQTGFSQSGQQGINEAQRYLIRQVYVPGTSSGTRKVTRVFQSPTPFQIPQWDAPLPEEVSFHWINLSGGFPSCLHKRIALEDLIGSIGFQGPAGSSAADYELIKGQVFQATNYTTWLPWCPEDGQKLVNGVWTRTQVEYVPPPLPKTLTKLVS